MTEKKETEQPETEPEMMGKMKTKTSEVAKKEKDKLKKFLEAIIPESYDKFDLESEYDSTLTYLENKDIIKDKVKALFGIEYRGESKKEQVKYMQGQQEKLNRARDEAIEKEILAYNEEHVYVENKELEAFYKPIDRALNKMCKGYSNLAFIKGRGAIGKSWNIRKVLLKNKAEFVEFCGDVTEAYLYRLFYENNGKILWFKDVVRVLKGMNSINLLKAATETEKKRVLSKSSYSKEQSDLPDRFAYTGRIIFDYNEVAGTFLVDDFEALKTRGDFVDLSFSMEDMKNLVRLIAGKKWQKEVTEYLIKHYEFTGQNLLNLRTQWKAFKTYEYCEKHGLDWQIELAEELKNSISKIRGMLYSLIGNRIVRTTELKKLLIRFGAVNTIRTASRKINDWILTEELFKASLEDRDFYVSLKPADLKTKQKYMD